MPWPYKDGQRWAFRLVKALAPGAVLRVVTDDPAAREDLGAWCRMTANELLSVERKDGYATYYVRRGASAVGG